jgi:hypothetical protein
MPTESSALIHRLNVRRLQTDPADALLFEPTGANAKRTAAARPPIRWSAPTVEAVQAPVAVRPVLRQRSRAWMWIGAALVAGIACTIAVIGSQSDDVTIASATATTTTTPALLVMPGAAPTTAALGATPATAPAETATTPVLADISPPAEPTVPTTAVAQVAPLAPVAPVASGGAAHHHHRAHAATQLAAKHAGASSSTHAVAPASVASVPAHKAAAAPHRRSQADDSESPL